MVVNKRLILNETGGIPLRGTLGGEKEEEEEEVGKEWNPNRLMDFFFFFPHSACKRVVRHEQGVLQVSGVS